MTTSGQPPLVRPDKAPLAFRVGVVGHRPKRLPEDLSVLRERIAQVLGVVKATVAGISRSDAQFYAEGPPLLTAVSPLAEGTDTLFASEAVEAGYRLCCPIPFWQEDYETDFPESAKPALYELLSRARSDGTVFELDGQRGSVALENKAYAAAGRIVVNQSDLLVAIWDGDRTSDKPGGTYQTIMEALQYNVPVVWISARAPYGWQILSSAPDFSEQTASGHATPDNAFADDTTRLTIEVSRIVNAEICLPASESNEAYTNAGHEDDQSDALPESGDTQKIIERMTAYFNEHKRSINLNFIWTFFRDLLGGMTIKWPKIIVGPYLDEQTKDKWLGRQGSVSMPSVNQQLVRYFAFADKEAIIFADAYRSNVLYTSFLAAFAVLLAVAPFAFHHIFTPANEVSSEGHHLFAMRLPIWALSAVALTEFVMLFSLLSLLNLAKKRRWHERWLEYRMLAEWIRQLHILEPLGGGRPVPRSTPNQFVYGRPTHSWMFWHVRAITRGVRLESKRVDPNYKAICLAALLGETSPNDPGQGAFHEANSKRCLKIDERLRTGSEILLFAALLSVLLHFGCTIVETTHLPLPHWLAPWIEPLSQATLLLTAGGPALGAALANINNQGEYAKIAKRSAAMKAFLGHAHARALGLHSRLAKGTDVPSLAEISRLAEGVSDSMIQEVVDWHSVVRDLPHGL